MTVADDKVNFIPCTGVNGKAAGKRSSPRPSFYTQRPRRNDGERAGLFSSMKGLELAPCRISNQRGRALPANRWLLEMGTTPYRNKSDAYEMFNRSRACTTNRYRW